MLLMAFQVLGLTMVANAIAQEGPSDESKPLPFVKDFQPKRYLGNWYEVARLPTRIQPPNTLAMAQYSATQQEGIVAVKNRAFDKQGNQLVEIQGRAKLVEGHPPGRLLVTFGPVFPDKTNYQVMFVDPEYQFAVVGVPDRKSLWILARKVPVEKVQLKRLRDRARNAGFDVSKLVIAPWEKISPIPGDGSSEEQPGEDKE